MTKENKELLWLTIIAVGLYAAFKMYEKKVMTVSEDKIIPTEFEN